MFKEFRIFISRGSAFDLAVGVIIGAAFGKIVSSLVNDVLMPPIGLLLGGVNFSALRIILKNASLDSSGKIIEAVSLNYGTFIQSIIDFIIIAFCIFIVVKAINTMKDMRKKEEETAAPVPQDVVLLTEIRDLLKK